jgi:hypothetical protein
LMCREGDVFASTCNPPHERQDHPSTSSRTPEDENSSNSVAGPREARTPLGAKGDAEQLDGLAFRTEQDKNGVDTGWHYTNYKDYMNYLKGEASSSPEVGEVRVPSYDVRSVQEAVATLPELRTPLREGGNRSPEPISRQRRTAGRSSTPRGTRGDCRSTERSRGKTPRKKRRRHWIGNRERKTPVTPYLPLEVLGKTDWGVILPS